MIKKIFKLLKILALIFIAFIILYILFLRPWLLSWGAMDSEINGVYPGDSLLVSWKNSSTRAITINASSDKIWPWLVQMGQGRGGLYSYDWLENLVGCEMYSADKILPQFQNTKLNDTIRMIPEKRGPLFFLVAISDSSKAFVLRAPKDSNDTYATDLIGTTWAFILNKIDSSTTRLIVRFRSDFKPTFSGYMVNKYVLEPIQFIMERKMMYGIKERAEINNNKK
jgi:hypothetical protein